MFFSTDALKCNKTITATEPGYNHHRSESNLSSELPRMLELARKPQDEDVYFEMHFAAQGVSEAHVVLSWTGFILSFLNIKLFSYNVYEISKTQ